MMIANHTTASRALPMMMTLTLYTLLAIGCGGNDSPTGDAATVKTGEAATATGRNTGFAKPGGLATKAELPFDDSAASGDWARFRGPTGMGTSRATGLPLTWSESENVVWKTPLPGSGASSPIQCGNRVYLTSYTGYLVPDEPEGSLDQLQRHLIALRPDDGEILWDRSVAAKLPEEETIRDHGYAANTPAADAERVYTFFGKSGVFAFDHDGEQLWQSDVGTNTSGWGTAASPVLYKDLVLINASVESERLLALDRKTGEPRWQAKGIREAWNTPLIVTTADGKDELVIAIPKKVLAFDPLTGEPLWTCDTDIGWYMVPSAVAADGVVYFLGGRRDTTGLAVRAGGRGEVTETHRLWTGNRGSNVSSPVYLDGHLYWMDESDGVAFCVQAEDGEIVYSQRLGRAGQVYASPLLAEGRIYYLTRSGTTFVLAAKPEFEQLAKNELSATEPRDRTRFDGSPAVVGSRILIRSGKYLYCFGK